jgi:O-antigen/teichoic acid export membrane protein
MTAVSTLDQIAKRPVRLLAVALSPAVAVFLSNNAANVGNLAYNMVFSRWMGPELFGALATLLTLKLSLLAVLNALQMAVSQRVSAGDTDGLRGTLVWLDRRLFRTAVVVALLLLPLALTGQITRALGLPDSTVLGFILLLAALPVTAPLCLMRGVAMGRLASGGIVASGQAEMAVRFLGGIVAWQAGLGLPGVVAALALSLVAGWWPLRRGLSGTAPAKDRTELAALAKLALPFAALQVAQVALLDGDVVVANLALSGHDVGLMAVLSLFQRIQFFACFGLAGVLLPAVSAAVARGETGLSELRPISALFLGLSVPLLTLMAIVPVQMISFVAGPAFADAAPALLATGLAAACFTASYLIAMFLAAWGDKRGLILIVAAVPIQFGAYAVAAQVMTRFGVTEMIMTKACVQAVLTLSLIALTAHRLRCGPIRAPHLSA